MLQREGEEASVLTLAKTISKTGIVDPGTNAKNFSAKEVMAQLRKPLSFQLAKESLSKRWITFLMTKQIAKEFLEKSLFLGILSIHVSLSLLK